MPASFELSVFINCPFDENFAPILQAIAFCVTDLGFVPRLAPENSDNGANRLDRILQLIGESKYAIHDISRCKAETVGEFSRMNMPFELGIDFGCRKFGSDTKQQKTLLVLQAERYDSHKSLSDIAGWDIHTHNNDHIEAVRIVRSWLVQQAALNAPGPAKIMGNYAAFQEWYWEKELENGASEEDILKYPTIELITAMQQWVSLGRPV